MLFELFIISASLGAIVYLNRPIADINVTPSPSGDGGVTGGSNGFKISALPDTDAINQGGKYSGLYDDAFGEGSSRYGVPFALLKAHAIRESALDKDAYRLEPTGKASYGLMQILWWKGSNRFKTYGLSDDNIGDGSVLYDPYTNVNVAAQIILENLNRFKNLRDAVNAYNTGVAEKTRAAPGNYVDDVLKYYSTLCGSSSGLT